MDVPRDDPTDAEQGLPFTLSRRCRRPRLVWTDADGEHALDLQERVLVGSSAHAHAIVNDRMVSRVHAELDPRDDGVWVRDLGSKNGTWIGDVRVQAARIPDDAAIRVGATRLAIGTAGDEKIPLWPSDRMGSLVACSESMRALFVRMSQYAKSDAAVLVRGETGTGKELVARSLHEASGRRAGPFVVVDCAALPDNLLESELFGHVKGAFTGAVATRAGAIETAHEGTVFLDEIGELPPAMQPKLLRVIESRTVRRIGEAAHRNVDVRFVAATHRDLPSMVGMGAFREDLYFRLAVLPVDVPPLRERPDDIPLLVQHFLDASSGVRVDDATMDALIAYPWLGNVRELRNFTERARAVGAAEALAMLRGGDAAVARRPSIPVPSTAPGMLPSVSLERPFKELREQWNDHLEREYIGGLVRKLGRNINAISEAAGLDRTYVHRLLRKHDL